MERLLVIGLPVLLAGCRPAESTAPVTEHSSLAPSSPEEPTPATPSPVQTEPSPPSEPSTQAPTMLSRADVWRQSKSARPPWERVEIVTVVFGMPAVVGEAVTVLPEHPGLPPLQLAIVNVVIHDELVDEGMAAWWEIELEPVSHPDYFDVTSPGDRSPEFPSGVVVVYPATPSATLLDPATLRPAELPSGILREGVEVAVDADGDGSPDAIELSTCSEDPTRPTCGEATATEIHRREPDGWIRVHRFEPAT